jgi:SAM-dependent methyltransferase
VDTTKLIQGSLRLTDIAFSFILSKAFQTAHDLGLFEALSDGSVKAEDLATRLKIHPDGCRRLLMTLVHLGLVERDSDGFHNSQLGQLCTSGSPVNLGVISNIDPFYRMGEHLSDGLREYAPQWERTVGVTGQGAFAALYADPVRLRQFGDLMYTLSFPQGQVVAESFDFGPHKCVMDVAGGPGGQVISIGRKHTHLRGIITDMEPVCVLARERIEANGLGNRFTAVAADLLEGPYPAGADVILLGHILHDWSDDKCRKILRNCAAALPRDGVLLISDSVLNNDFSGSGVAHIKDLVMLLANEPGARERSQAEFESLLNDAGFEFSKLVRLDAPRDLIVARKR